MLIPINGYYNPAKNGKQVIQIWNKKNLFDIFTYEVEGIIEGYVLGIAPRSDLMNVLFYHIQNSEISLEELFEEFMESAIDFQEDCIPENVKVENLVYCSLSNIPLIGASLKF